MTLSGSDVAVMLTTQSGSAGSSLPQSDPSLSTGKYASTTALVSAALGALFSTVSAAQATAGYTDYRCVAVRNLSSADSMTNAVLYLSDPAGGGTYAIGLDPAGIVDFDASAAQGTTIADTTSAPSGVTFSSPTQATPLSVGTIGPGKVQLVWIRRVIPAATPGQTDTVSFVVRAEV